MSLILQIETATTVCSVALAEDGVVLACKELEQRNAHAEVITVFIDDLLKTTGKQYSELAAVAVSSGPGSYTGLRIGVSVAKGLCFALDIPLIAVETLEAMADGIIGQHIFDDNHTLLCPMIDARRMEVFTAVFDADENRIRPTSAEIIDENSFSDLLKNSQILFFGDGAAKCSDVLKSNSNAQIMPGFTISARYLTKRVAEKFRLK